MDKTALIKEYDDHFKEDPQKWTAEERDEFAFKALSTVVTKAPENILDIGCGNGHTLEYFLRFWPKTKMVGLDLSTVGLEVAAKAVPNGIFQAGFLSDFKTEERFEVILNMGTAEHFEHLNSNLKILKSLLAKGGYCYFEAPNNLRYSSGEHSYRRLKTGSKQMEWHLNSQEWEKIIKEVGFTIVRRFQGRKPYWEFIWLLR